METIDMFTLKVGHLLRNKWHLHCIVRSFLKIRVFELQTLGYKNFCFLIVILAYEAVNTTKLP